MDQSGTFVRVWLGRVPGWLMALLGAGALLGMGSLTRPKALAPESPEDAGGRAKAASPQVRYARDIRRLFSDRCFQCHGPDAGTRVAELRLDTPEGATSPRTVKGQAEPAAIVPGDAGASELWKRISSEDPALVMPPRDSNKRPLSDEEKALIKQWIDEGAKYEPHWAFVAPKRPAVPAVQAEAWPKNAIDRFVLANLEAKGVQASPEADRATLARRVFLDLTGLPPTPEEVGAFERDTTPDAYERLVDRLLTEEPYRSRTAERLATPWLDAARYGDTSGIHADNGRQAWVYRDWVLRAYRDNMPFDRFLTEQLAGDLLPDATLAQKVASGFNRMHVTTDEGGAIAEEYLVEYAVDRASTTASVFMGLTLGCARCHDHKFDPISQEDFYGLFAFFNSIDEPGLYSQTPDSNRAYEPFIKVPSAEQATQLATLEGEIAALTKRLDEPWPGEGEKFGVFERDAKRNAGVRWTVPEVAGAVSSDPGTSVKVDDSRVVSMHGPAPASEDVTITFRSPREFADAPANVLAIQVLPAEGENGKLGRAINGNAVVTGVVLETRKSQSEAWVSVPLIWAWADYSQQDLDLEAGNVLDVDDPANDASGWGLAGHQRGGPRVLMLLASHMFGAAIDPELRVTIQCRSIHEQHSLSRVRVAIGAMNEEGMASLPTMLGRWHTAGPIDVASSAAAYDAELGPEKATRLDPQARFGPKDARWRFDGNLTDGKTVTIPGDTANTYLGRWIWTPRPRSMRVAIGSDDGFRLFVNGVEFAGKKVDRSVALDQDLATIPLAAGANFVVLKVVNTGGIAGYAFRELSEQEFERLNAAREASKAAAKPDDAKNAKPTSEPASSAATLQAKLGDAAADGVPTVARELVGVYLPTEVRWPALDQSLTTAWRRTAFPEYKAVEAERNAKEEARRELDSKTPLAMVMKELEKPRDTFVLTRGQYDKPDKSRPIGPRPLKAIGRWPLTANTAASERASTSTAPDAPPNPTTPTPPTAPRATRRDLAAWLLDPEHPLVARVAVNRIWQTVFGTGLVRTSEDFGQQGEWPSHPELLDWLAVEFREHTWDSRRILRMIVTSATYRQSSRVRTDLAERDADNRWLSYYPRRRLSAEQIRDLALYTSGLLVERLAASSGHKGSEVSGGPSVKTYHPAPAEWKEIALPGSNTQDYVRAMGDDLWRRSLYTYWKRAAPPPSLLLFDAPTRESCTVRRPITSTPLQALAFLNDEQILEAARELALRTLAEAGAASDADRLRTMFLRCTSRVPNADELAMIQSTLDAFRRRFKDKPEDAVGLLKAGSHPIPDAAKADELGAWTILASSILNLHETLTQD